MYIGTLDNIFQEYRNVLEIIDNMQEWIFLTNWRHGNNFITVVISDSRNNNLKVAQIIVYRNDKMKLF